VKSTEELLDFVGKTDYSGIPTAVQEKTRLCLLDGLGSAVAGHDTPVGKIVSGFVSEVWPRGGATVILGGRSSPAGAALANGYMANALDIDDGGKYTRGHPGAQLVPTVLALGERYGKSGEEALAGLAVGYETAHRVGGCLHERFEEYRACGSWGSVASAAAAANLLGLGKREIGNALGVAEYNSPYLPMERAIDRPAMVKHGTGWGAMTGIMAAELARKGFTGPGTTFAGPQCKSWFEDLGDRYIMAEENGVEFKEIPSCSWGHPPIKAALGLVDKYSVEANEIEKVVVEGFSEMAALYRGIPETEEEAQFSVSWPLAVALTDGEVSPEAMKRGRFDDPELRDMAERIVIKESAELTKLNESLSGSEGETSAWPARVRIVTDTGRIYDSGTVKSEPGEMATFPRLVEKFKRFAGPYLSGSKTEEIVGLVREFASLERVDELTDLL